MTFSVSITPAALAMLKDVSDARLRRLIAERIAGLAVDPDEQGKPLLGEFKVLRSLRAAGQRFRIIYSVDDGKATVCALAIGRREDGGRRDVYELARKLLRQGLLGHSPRR